MINANELRIGNWVEHGGVDMFFKVIELHPKAISIGRNDLIEDVLTPDELLPIRLSHEILEKCGFMEKIITGKSWGNDGDKIITYINKKGNMQIIGEKVYYSIEFGLQLLKPNLKYLHQLQNLYFALTGEELNYQP